MTDIEDVDYMSDDFLAKCAGENDIRPGLAVTHSMKRKYDLEKKKADKESDGRKKLKITELRANRLEEGLGTAIDSSNKGYAMLQKMGYQPGTSLGKEGKGRLEPVGVELKCDRKGLGWQKIISDRRKLRELQNIKRLQEKQDAIDPNEYRARLSNKHNQKLIDADLWKSKKTCYNLDQSIDITEPHEKWFWPDYTFPQDEEEEDNDEFIEMLNPSDQLDVLTCYLRETYLYCIWCGQTYEDTCEFNNLCPGNTRSDHD